MKIQVKNFGIIEKGTIDLNKPLTVFCGQNGTGKTYLSYLIYALVSDNMSPVQPLSQTSIDELAETGSTCIQIHKENAISFRHTTLEMMKERLDKIFGISKKNAQKVFKDFEMNFLSTDEEYIESVRKMHIILKIKLNGGTYKVEKKNGKMEFYLRRDKRQVNNLDALQLIRYLASTLIYQRFLTHGIRTAQFFAVERSSIFTFSKELMISRNNLIDIVQDRISDNPGYKSQVSRLLESNSNRYPMAIRDNIRFASDLTQIIKEEGDYAAVANEIEELLLHGNHVDVDSDGNVYIQVGKTLMLPIQMGASVAKTLAPLILTLRHKTQQGDILIIDEPELNLHPAAQIRFARIIAKLINKGLRVLISTHSDYFIREINNMIMWAEPANKNSEAFKKLGYANDETIGKDKVGVYVFNYSNAPSEKVVIENVEVGKTGFSIETIDDAIRTLNESAEDAFSSLY